MRVAHLSMRAQGHRECSKNEWSLIGNAIEELTTPNRKVEAIKLPDSEFHETLEPGLKSPAQ